VLISALAWRLRSKNPAVLVGWLWFLGTLVPVIGLVQVGSQAMADRYMYLPAIGLFVAAVFGIADWQKVFKFRTILATAAALVLLACIALTEYQLQFWQNTQTLFSRALAITKNNGPAHMMLGVRFERSGQPEEALRQYQLGLECDPSLVVQVTGGEKRPLAAQVQLLLGQSAEQQSRPDEALAHYRDALQIDSNLVEADNNLGNLLDALGKPAEALTNYQAAVHLRPEEPLVHENLGTQLLELGRFDDAMSEYEEASRLAPSDPRPFYLMGKAWLRRGQSVKAIMNFETAVRNDANDYQSLTFLARIFASDEDPQVRNGKLAAQLADKANGLTEGKQPFVLASLAMAYAEAGRFEDARQTATGALRLTATNTEVYSNLRAQLRLYEANHPFRESFTNAEHAPAR
jgi:tetratricopeptide (TPR) repeat protein